MFASLLLLCLHAGLVYVKTRISITVQLVMSHLFVVNNNNNNSNKNNNNSNSNSSDVSLVCRQKQLFIAIFGHEKSFVMVMTIFSYAATNETSPYQALHVKGMMPATPPKIWSKLHGRVILSPVPFQKHIGTQQQQRKTTTTKKKSNNNKKQKQKQQQQEQRQQQQQKQKQQKQQKQQQLEISDKI